MALRPQNMLQCIAHILSFSPNATALETQLQQFTDEDWLDLVKVGSSHLVLTTIYCRLQQKQLLQVLPKDLKTYLHDLTAINRNRNTTILEQVVNLSQLLKTNNINHVFLKGAALLVSGYYKDIGERMIGDIDVLLANSEIETTSQLLQNHGYKYNNTTFGAKYFEYHHDTRLILQENGIAAVELHRHVLHSHYNRYLITNDVLLHKTLINGYYIPSKDYLIENVILNFEINDYGYLYAKLEFRNAYDFLCLSQNEPDDALKTLWNKGKYHTSFLTKIKFYFGEIDTHKLNSISGLFRQYIFKHSQNKKTLFSKVYFYYANSVRHSKDILVRLSVFLTNKNYRKEAWQDRKRLIGLLKAKFLR
ncbi:nucleotidyltransferase family protein [Winogradskyella sp.]|nr:nucleotidyltransferase family protein [Winogradskyella sp.]